MKIKPISGKNYFFSFRGAKIYSNNIINRKVNNVLRMTRNSVCQNSLKLNTSRIFRNRWWAKVISRA